MTTPKVTLTLIDNAGQREVLEGEVALACVRDSDPDDAQHYKFKYMFTSNDPGDMLIFWLSLARVIASMEAMTPHTQTLIDLAKQAAAHFVAGPAAEAPPDKALLH